jgi:hypothetical protein
LFQEAVGGCGAGETVYRWLWCTINDLSMLHGRINEMSMLVMQNEWRKFVSVNDAQ